MSFDWTDFEAKRKQDGGIPVFYVKAVEVRDKEGVIVEYENQDWVKIHTLGDNKSLIDKRVTEREMRRWPDKYDAWKKGQDVPENGTPLGECGALTPAEVAALKHIHCHSVEEFCSLSDSAIHRLGHGWVARRNKAQQFLMIRGKPDPEKEQLKKRLEELEKLVGDLKKPRKANVATDDNAERPN